jgi:alpha-glucosidase
MIDSVYFNNRQQCSFKSHSDKRQFIYVFVTQKDILVMTFPYAIDKSHSHGYNFLEVTEEAEYYQIQTSKVKCYSKK